MKPTFERPGDVPVTHRFHLGVRSTGSAVETSRSICRALSVAMHGTADWDLVYADPEPEALRLALYDGAAGWHDQLSFDTLWEADDATGA